MHDPGVMLLPSASGHLSVYYDGIISSDLDCSFLQGRSCHLGLSLWGVSFEIQGEVNLPHVASSIDPSFTGLNDDIVQIGWVGQGLKPHFFKNRNMDKGKVRVVQNPICSCSKKLVLQEKRCIFSNFCNYSVSFCAFLVIFAIILSVFVHF